jgi:hypothetical protein
MKGLGAAMLLGLAVGCGAGETSGNGDAGTDAGAKNLANFLGAAWNVTQTTTVSCPGRPPDTSTDVVSITFSPGTGTDLQYTSQAGCTYMFNVSGDTASLANAPVTCTTAISGLQVTLTWTSYTATTSDGHEMTSMSAGTASAQGLTCPFSISGSATR